CATLLSVPLITSTRTRGIWSVVVFLLVLVAAVVLALTGAWEWFVATLGLDVRINAGGYFLISGGLFVAWSLATFVIDRQTYAVFRPGQFVIHESIGGDDKVFDTMGLMIERQRGDVFRLLLGLGAGDLIVKTSGVQAHQFELPNVLFVGHK